MSIFDSRLKYVTCRLWDTTAAPRFPETDDPDLAVPHLASTANVGVAFSGGGTRAASAAVGQLRGLAALGLLPHIRFMSSVSGGAWTCVPFTYLPSHHTETAFLGHVIDPERITLAHLTNLDRNSFAHVISRSVLIDDLLKQAMRFAGDELYSRALGDTFLLPLGIDSLERFFTATPQSRDHIVGRNADRMRADDFFVARAERPFLIVGGTILRPDNESPLVSRIHLEMTPLYVGAAVLHAGAGSRGRGIGGGFVEPFGFDSDAPEQAPRSGAVRVRLGANRHRFTLSDVLGTTGSAPAEVVAQAGLRSIGFPEFKYWSPAAPRRAEKEYLFGDGGILENLGLMPLLRRKVERIVVFVNSNHAIESGINNSIPPLFGQTPGFLTNHVFDAARFGPLLEGLRRTHRERRTSMHRETYTVRENGFYGIDGGWQVEVLWIYNERVGEWEDRLRPEVAELISQGSLGSFPQYKTFFENPPAIIDLSPKQVSMLAHLSCWNVMKNESEMRQMLA